MPEHILKVNEENASLRLDVFLTKNLPSAPTRTMVRRMIDVGNVYLNGKVVKAHHKVRVGDEVVAAGFISGQEDVEDLEPENIKLDIFYEDLYLLVVNKPAGMLVHPARGICSGTLVNALLYHCQKLSDVNTSFRPGIVHRLDRETSGLMLVAKDNKTHVRLARQFEKGRIKKEYVALVKGEVPFDEGVIDAPLGKHHKHFDKRAVLFEEGAKEAKTFYRVARRFGKKVSLVQLFPQSGRMHQLRVHMSHLGHAILGDEKYGEKRSFSRMALHAKSIAFTHPTTKAHLGFTSFIPKEFFL